MGTSRVTDFMIDYMQKNDIYAPQMAAELEIPEEKFAEGYKEPLFADEFLELCIRLHLRPEDVASAIRKF